MKTEYIKRYLFFLVGLFVMSIGVAFSIKADLGTSPISSVPYVLSLTVPISVGQLTIAMHCLFVLLQIVILRKKYQLIQLMQIPVAIVFGMMIDFSVYLLRNLQYSSYFVQWIFCLIGIILVAVGVSMEVTANVVTLAGEGLVLAICKVLPVKFSNMKMCFDCVLVVIAALISILMKGELLGIREGTIAAAVFVGLLSKPICLPMTKWMNQWISVKEK